jgi:hypothetical protein
MADRFNPLREPNDFYKEVRKPRSSVWYLSQSALEKSIIGATITFSFIFAIVWLVRASFLVDQSDIQTTVQISAGLGALSLAVPLFLKDFKIQETLWKSFMILSSIFLISTCTGFVAYLLQSDSEEVKLAFVCVVSVIVVSNFRTAMALQRLRSMADHTFVHVSPTTPLEFLFVILLSFVCIVTSNGPTASFLLLFSYGIMMLFATLAASIISALSHHDNQDRRLKNAIREVLEKNPDKAFTMLDLLSALREGPYSGQSELVSQSILEDAVREMDRESEEGEPKASFVNGKIIPRWNDDHKKQSFKDLPSILVFESQNDHEDIKDIISNLRSDYSEELLDFLSRKSGFSVELLEDGNVIHLFLGLFDSYWKYNSVTMVYTRECVEKVENEERIELNPLFDKVVESFRKSAWFCNELKYGQEDIVSGFIEHLFSNQIESFIRLFGGKIEDKEFLEMFNQDSGSMEWQEIREKFEKLLRKNLPELEDLPEFSFLGKLAESAIDSFLRRKLQEFCRIGRLEHIIRKGRMGALLHRMGESSADLWKLRIDEKN